MEEKRNEEAERKRQARLKERLYDYNFRIDMAKLKRVNGNDLHERRGREIPNPDRRGYRRGINESNQERFEDINQYNENLFREKKLYYDHVEKIIYLALKNEKQKEKFINNPMRHLGHSNSTNQIHEQTRIQRNYNQRNSPQGEDLDYPAPISQFYGQMTLDYPESYEMEYP